MNSDTKIISRCAFLKESASLQKLKNKVAFQVRHILFKKTKAMAFKVLYFFVFTVCFKFTEFSYFKQEVVIALSCKTQNQT